MPATLRNGSPRRVLSARVQITQTYLRLKTDSEQLILFLSSCHSYVIRVVTDRRNCKFTTSNEMAMSEAEDLIKHPSPAKALMSIGFTRNEANAFLSRIENKFTADKTKIVRYRQYRSSLLDYRGLLTVVCAYALMVWVYVIAMQLRWPDAIYWPLALWLPIRIDYLGEMAFVGSFFLACGACIAKVRLTRRKDA